MDPAAFHTIVQLIRNGTFSTSDAEEIARRLDAEGERDRAHAVRAALVEAWGEQPSEERRANIVMVPRLHMNPDGGNAT